jgi:hypothetical protein
MERSRRIDQLEMAAVRALLMLGRNAHFLPPPTEDTIDAANTVIYEGTMDAVNTVIDEGTTERLSRKRKREDEEEPSEDESDVCEKESDDEAAEDEGILLLTEKQTVQYWFNAAFPESKSQYSDNNIDHLNGILRLEKVQSHPADTPLGALRENLQAKRRALLDGRSHLPPLAVTYSECLQMNTPRL